MKKLLSITITPLVVMINSGSVNAQQKSQSVTQGTVKSATIQNSSVKPAATNQQTFKPVTTTQASTARTGSYANRPGNMSNNTRTSDGNRQNSNSPFNEVVVTGVSSRNRTGSNQSNQTNTGNNTEDPVIDQVFTETDPFSQIFGNQSTGQKKILGNSLLFDSVTRGIQVFGQEVVNAGDIFGIIKNKVSNRNRNNQNTSSGPVSADDFSMSMVKKSTDITSEAVKIFKTLRKGDATVKAMDAKLTSNGIAATESYFGREIQYEGMDGSLKTIKLYLQKYEMGEEKYCLAHVQVSAKGNSQSLESSACFMKDMNGEAQILYLQDCFGLIITPGTSANSMPCAGDFNWETLKAGVGNFL